MVPGDTVSVIPLPGISWSTHETQRDWSAVALSDDGTRFIAANNGGGSTGLLYTSADAGATWTAGEISRRWAGVAASADGSSMVAVAYTDRIFTSADSGATWTARENERPWSDVASSADATKLIAVGYPSLIFTSTDSGATWIPRATERFWTAAACSGDGSRMVAVADTDFVYISTDGGLTWQPKGASRQWQAVTMTADGMTVIAGDGTVSSGRIHISRDGGETWTMQGPAIGRWRAVDASADGNTVVAANESQIHVSTDAGVTWRPSETGFSWNAVATNASGERFAAVRTQGPIFLSSPNLAQLTFLSAPDQFGTNYAAIGFQVEDDGPDGVKVDPTPNTIVLNVAPVNDAPVVGTPLPDVVTPHGSPFVLTCASATFTDVDPGTQLTWSARQEDGQPLPAWLSFSQATRTFSGTPGSSDQGTVAVAVTASDNGQPPLSARTGFRLTVVSGPPSGTDGSVTIPEDTPFQFSAADFGFSDPLDDPPNALVGMMLTTLPTAGQLTVDGMPMQAGELIDFVPVNGVWTAREQLRHWSQVVMSADGMRMAATARFGRIYTSADGGATWQSRENDRYWSSIASSADGTKLVSAVSNGRLYTSTDAGASWTARENSRDWRRVVSSADGTTLAALENEGRIHMSYDSGLTWQARAVNRPWHGIVMSADGLKLAATTAFEEPPFISNDGGATWKSEGQARMWRPSLAGSADGSRLFAIAYSELLTSTDSGVTWTPIPNLPLLALDAVLTSSADGSKIVLANGGVFFTSRDAGSTWTRREITDGRWVDVDSSADGTALVALKRMEHGPLQIYTSVAAVPTIVYTPAPNGFGSPHATFTFQVVDDGGSGGSIDPTPRNFTINVTPQRDGPAAGTPPPDQLAIDGVPFAFQFPENTFVHPDPGAVMSYAAHQVNGGPLPEWVSFSPTTRTFAGTPADADKGAIEILLTATDNGLPALTATSRFRITVPNEAPAGTDFQATILEDSSLVIDAANFGFSDPNDSPSDRFSRVRLTTLPAVGTLTIDGVPADVGERVSVIPDFLSSWQRRESDRAWSAIASSADGTRLAATVTDGRIFSSLDAGATWTARASERAWKTIASSADGTRLIAAAPNDFVYLSSDTGQTWTPRHSARDWRAVASSADGTRLVAAEFAGWLWLSSDAGATWTDRGDFRRWTGVASSSDGRHLFAAEDNGQILVSSDFGVTWAPRADNERWIQVRCSADGRRAVALGTDGRLHGSPDFGATWTLLRPDTQWSDVALSADGMTVCAVQNPGRIAHSIDAGATWSLRESIRSWTGVACSADGKSVAATVLNGPIFTSLTGVPRLVFTPAPNGAGSPYASFSFQVEDDGFGGLVSDQTPNTFTLNVLPINDAPVVARVLSDQLATERAPFKLVIPVFTFSDPDPLDVLTLAARSATGSPLPAWLSFNPLTRTFSGTPGTSDVGFIDVRLTATDDAAPPLSASTDFLLRVANVDETPTGTPGTVSLEANASHRFTAADFGFADPNDRPAHHFGRVKITTVPSSGSLTLDGSPITPGQFAVIQPIPSGATWTARTQPKNWRAIASSADGRRLVAAEFVGGRIHTSDDAGATWTPRGGSRQWIAVASSSDGQRLLAAEAGGNLHLSTNGGITWSPRHTPGNWTCVASSADGLKLAAAQRGGPVVISSDGGANWTPVGANRQYRDLALSADGSRLIAAVENDQLYTSADGGHSWSARATSRAWQTVASSADGLRLFAGAHAGGLHASSDGGATWRQCEISRSWRALDVSADGTKLVAAEYDGLLYTSTDAGLNWRPRASRNFWVAVAMSADGSRLAATGSQAPIFTSSEVPAQSLVFTPAPDTTGAPYATLSFQVEDDGTANANLDPTPRLLNLNVVPPSQSPFAIWARANGRPTDPNVNGGADLLVFAFGLPPGTLPTGALTVGNGQILQRGSPALLAGATPVATPWQLIFGRRKDSGLTYRVQATADLRLWEEVAGLPTVLADDGIIEACQVVLPGTLSDGRTPRFARVTVTTD